MTHKLINRHLIERIKKRAKLKSKHKDFTVPDFEKPIFIVSAPRAGSTLLFETLSCFPGVWTTGDENHELIERIPKLHPRSRNYDSNVLTKHDCDAGTAKKLLEGFTFDLQDRNRQRYIDLPEDKRPSTIRFIEKTPKNSLRIPFLKAVFPDALFIFLYRDPKENIASLIEGWKSGRFVAYWNLPGWEREPWSFLLIPGWPSLKEAAIAEIAANQWKTANKYIIDKLNKLPISWQHFLTYQGLIDNPEKIIKTISNFADLKIDKQVEKLFSGSLPVSSKTLTPPAPDKWKKYENEIERVLDESLLTAMPISEVTTKVSDYCAGMFQEERDFPEIVQ